MNAWNSLFAVLILVALVFIGVAQAEFHYMFGVIIPYLAFIVFLVGVVYRVVKWSTSPVPFHIPTTCGQQKSLPWIKNDNFESPHNTFGVIVRLFLEVVFFRSLFRNTKAELHGGPKLVYGGTKWLWLGSLIFHYSFLIIFLRHFKYFTEPVPYFIDVLQFADSFFQIGLPLLYITDILFVIGVTFLFLRRVFDAKLRYISLMADYFPLFLILGIGVTGILMRYFFKVEIVGVKQLATGLLGFSPYIPDNIGTIFYVHLFLVCVLLAYFPFSKLMHMGGVFLSPTRNLANNSRAVRHINPWNPEVKTHTYSEYEDEFRGVMKAVDLPLEREE